MELHQNGVLRGFETVKDHPVGGDLPGSSLSRWKGGIELTIIYMPRGRFRFYKVLIAYP